jgi:hypothetical protein
VIDHYNGSFVSWVHPAIMAVNSNISALLRLCGRDRIGRVGGASIYDEEFKVLWVNAQSVAAALFHQVALGN